MLVARLVHCSWSLLRNWSTPRVHIADFFVTSIIFYIKLSARIGQVMSFEDKSLGQLHANGCLGVSSCEITDYYNNFGECPCRALLLLSHCKILKHKQRYLVINLCLSVNQFNDFPVILCVMHSFIRQDGCYRCRANRWCVGHPPHSPGMNGLTTTLASTLMLSTGISNKDTMNCPEKVLKIIP